MIRKFEIHYVTSRGRQEIATIYAFDIIDAKNAFIYGHPGYDVELVKQVS